MANLDLTDLTPGAPPYHVDTLFEVDVPGIGTRSAKLGELLNSPIFTGTPTAPTAAPGTITTQLATTAFVDDAITAIIAASDAMVFKGVIDCSAFPDYPAADQGDTYRVSVDGKIGGASGPNVEAGDLLICLIDGTVSGTHAAVGASWSISQTNLDGSVIGPASAVDSRVAAFDGTTGKLIKDGGIATSALLVSGGALGTPASGVATNLTGLPIGTGVSGLGTNVAVFLGTPSSANLLAAITDETGSGALVFAVNPVLVTPNLGTPVAAVLTNATGLPLSSGIDGFGAGVATFLGAPSSANLAAAVTGETGTGALVFGTSPTITGPVGIGIAPQTAKTLSVKGTTADATASALVLYDGSDRIIGNFGNTGRLDTWMYADDGALIALGVIPTTPANGQRAGHYAFTARNSLAQQHTIGILESHITDITNTSMDSSISLRYMDAVDGNPGSVYTYQQPNKTVSISSAGLSLPTIPILGVTNFTMSGTLLSGAAVSFNGPGGFARTNQFYTSAGTQFGRHSADASGPANIFTKSRHATVGSHTAVVSGDDIGTIAGAGSDGTAYIIGVQTLYEVDAAVSTNIVPGRVAWLTMNAAGTMLERMRLNSSGGLYIGSGNVDPGANNLNVQGAIIYTGKTYANRPGAPATGMVINITDSNTVVWGATVAGGGANNVLARYNGTDWTVIGV